MKVFYVLLTFICAFVVADVDLTAPDSGSTYTASGGSAAVTIKWKDTVEDDDDSAASLSKVLTYTILLCYGAEDGTGTIKCLDDDPILKAQKVSGTSYKALIDASMVPNGYYASRCTLLTLNKDTLSIIPKDFNWKECLDPQQSRQLLQEILQDHKFLSRE